MTAPLPPLVMGGARGLPRRASSVWHQPVSSVSSNTARPANARRSASIPLGGWGLAALALVLAAVVTGGAPAAAPALALALTMCGRASCSATSSAPTSTRSSVPLPSASCVVNA